MVREDAINKWSIIKMRRMAVAVIILAVLMAAAFGDRSFRNYWLNTSGKLSDGGAFGVAIGASTQEVLSTMSKGGYEPNDAICIDATTSPTSERTIVHTDIENGACDEIYIYYKDDGIVFGRITFSMSQGFVRQISWRYSILNT